MHHATHSITPQQLIENAVTAARANDSMRPEILFETGMRGATLKNYAEQLILSYIPGLAIDIDQKHQEALTQLTNEYAHLLQRHNPKKPTEHSIRNDQAVQYAREDMANVKNTITQSLPEKPTAPGTIAYEELLTKVKIDLKPSFHDNDTMYHYSESHPRPVRSNILMPMLLTRIKGLDTTETLENAETQLAKEFEGLPKKDGTKIGPQEAQWQVKEAMIICESTINRYLPHQKTIAA